MVGRRREVGVGVLETESWKSGVGVEDEAEGDRDEEARGTGVTTSSRQSGELR